MTSRNSTSRNYSWFEDFPVKENCQKKDVIYKEFVEFTPENRAWKKRFRKWKPSIFRGELLVLGIISFFHRENAGTLGMVWVDY